MDSIIRLGLEQRFVETILNDMDPQVVHEKYVDLIYALCLEGDVSKGIETLQAVSSDLDRLQNMQAFAACLDGLNRLINRDASLATIIQKERRTFITPADEGFLTEQVCRSFLLLLEDSSNGCISLFGLAERLGYCNDAIRNQFMFCTIRCLDRLSKENRFHEAIDLCIEANRQCTEFSCANSMCNILNRALEKSREVGIAVYRQICDREFCDPGIHNAALRKLTSLGYVDDALVILKDCDEQTRSYMIDSLCARGLIGDIHKAEQLFTRSLIHSDGMLDLRLFPNGMALLAIKKCVDMYSFGKYRVLVEWATIDFIQQHLEKALPWWGVRVVSEDPPQLEFYNKQFFDY